MNTIRLLPIMALLLTEAPLCAQQTGAERLTHGVSYSAEAQVTLADGPSPLWLNANKHGLSSLNKSNGYMRGTVQRPISADSLRRWRIGYGADVALAYNFTSSLIVQQLYADLEYRNVRLSVGSKEQPMQLKDNLLSSGSQTFGINARPIPQLRLEIPRYINLDKGHWIGVKGHIGYGIMTDGKWKKGYATERYTRRTLFHTKAGYLRLGNEEKIPLVLEGGLEMACQFGGDFYENNGDGTFSKTSLPKGFKQYVEAIYSGGSDPGEGIYANAGGNTVGSWTASLSYKFPTWKLRAYYDHFFEDHSQMFLEYGLWKDGLCGLEITLPQNRFVSTLVAEYMYTKDQTGPIYHDHTPEISDQISAADNYYNHYIYNGWQHWGQAIGNPLYTSPLYNANGQLTFMSNRFKAYHIGLSGTPISQLSYRLLYSYQESWGTYANPFTDKKYNSNLLVELGYSPRRIGRLNTAGVSVSAAYGMSRGDLTGNTDGLQITLRKTGILTR